MAQIPVAPDRQTLKHYDRLAVLDRCSRDHEGKPSRILKVEPGHGRHIHDAACGYDPARVMSCMRHCDDSDVIVELEYGAEPGGYRAIYALVDGEFRIWAD